MDRNLARKNIQQGLLFGLIGAILLALTVAAAYLYIA